MANIMDYLSWRGDLSFAQDPFNEADAVVLARLSYLQLDGIVDKSFDESVTLREAAEQFLRDKDRVKGILWKGDDELLRTVGESERFGHCPVSCYVNVVEDDIQMQFSAMIIRLEDDLHYVGFRGTDNSIVGWQEDFNMFCTFPVPAHISALNYLIFAAQHYDGDFIVGGHSKGGNLSIYSASFCGVKLQERIRAVYNLDGPGFDADAMTSSNFQHIKDRMHTFVPQSSVFGMMFEHEESYTIIKSTQTALLQHDIYSWEIVRNHLHVLSETSAASALFDRTFSSFIKSLSPEERTAFTEAVFSIVKSTEDKTFTGIAENWRKDSAVIFKSIKNMEPETKAVIMSTLSTLVRCAKENFQDVSKLNAPAKAFKGLRLPEFRKPSLPSRT